MRMIKHVKVAQKSIELSSKANHIILFFILAIGGFPYPTITNAELLEHLEKGMRLEKPENCSQDV